MAWNDVTPLLYRGITLVLALGLAAPVAAAGQDRVTRGVTEWSITVSAARGVGLLESSGGERYAMPTFSWGRVLTDLRGPSLARGRFEWAVEVSPLVVEWSSGHARGLGVSPLQWRWNLAPHHGVHAFAEVGGGALWTTAPVPAGTTGSNFMTHAGVGFRLLGGRAGGLVAGYRLHHISNGNRLRRNPGVNAHLLMLGYTRVTRP